MILEVDNIELNFDQTSILQGIYLKAETQKVTCILGRNGCGKSSLLKIIFGSLKAKYSLVRLNKNPITKKFFQTGLVNYLPQHHLKTMNYLKVSLNIACYTEKALLIGKHQKLL